jgi:malonate transporter and related proteins
LGTKNACFLSAALSHWKSQSCHPFDLMNEFQIIAMVISILAPVIVGWIIVRMGWIEASADHILTWLFLHVCTPPLIVLLLASQNLTELFDIRFILATLLMMFLLYVGLLFVHMRLLRRPLDIAAMAAFAGTKFNTVIVGFPVLLATIGHHAIVPIIINLIAGYFTILPLTLICTNAAKSNSGTPLSVVQLFVQALKKACTHPLVLATITGLLLAALELPIAPWLEGILQTFGDAAIPLALLAVGMSLNAIDLRNNFSEISWMSAVRVILSPILAIIVAIGFDLQPVFAIALVISFSLPTAKLVLPLAREQGVYAQRTAGIITTTTFSLVLVWPIIIWICEHLWPGIIG